MTDKEDKMSEKVAMCLLCRGEFTHEQLAGAKACPTCGNKGIPADPREKQTITLTAHEWRILFIWASNWAAKCDTDPNGDGHAGKVIEAIEREARRQQGSLPALSMRAEIQEVANVFGKVTAYLGDGEEIIEPEKKH